MSELDQISRLLGSIETKLETNGQQLGALFNKVDIIRREHAETFGIVKELHSRVELLEKEVAEDVVPTVQEMQRLKQRGIGILTVIGLLGAGAGFLLTKAFKYLHFAG